MGCQEQQTATQHHKSILKVFRSQWIAKKHIAIYFNIPLKSCLSAVSIIHFHCKKKNQLGHSAKFLHLCPTKVQPFDCIWIFGFKLLEIKKIKKTKQKTYHIPLIYTGHFIRYTRSIAW